MARRGPKSYLVGKEVQWTTGGGEHPWICFVESVVEEPGESYFYMCRVKGLSIPILVPVVDVTDIWILKEGQKARDGAIRPLKKQIKRGHLTLVK